MIQYANGDGNDTIYGFDSADTLNITSGTISKTSLSGNDFIIYVGSGNITLKDVAGLTLNLKLKDGTDTTIRAEEQIVWTISGTTATGKLGGKVVAKITGLKKGTKASDLYVKDKIVTVSKNALTTSSVNITGNYTLALAEGISQSEITTAAGWYIDGTSATYKTLGRTAGYSVAANGKSISYTKAATSKDLTTVKGLKEGVTADDLTLDTKKKTVTVNTNALGTGTATISGGYTFKLASDVAKSTTTKAGWDVFWLDLKYPEKTGTTAIYTSAAISEGYVLSSNKKSLTYRPASGGETLITVRGLKSRTLAKYLSLNTKTKTVTLSKKALDANSTVELEGDYKLALGSDVTKSKTTAAHWSINNTTAKYIATKTTTGYKVSSDKKSVDYVTASGGETLATITGLKKGLKANALSIDTENKVITLSKNALGTGTVKVKGDYTLALADDVALPTTADAQFVVSGTTAKYVATKTSAGYTLSDDKKSVTYSKATGGATLATIGGLKAGVTADEFSISGNVIRIYKDVGGKNGLTVNGKDYHFIITAPYKVTVNGTVGSVGGWYNSWACSGETLIGGKGNDTLAAGNIGGSKINYVSGGDGNDYLDAGQAQTSATVLGGNGNDTLVANNVRGYCTLTGGKGNDVFRYSKNHTVVTDYTEGQDKIWCFDESSLSHAVEYAEVVGNDVCLLTEANPNISTYAHYYVLKNAKGKKITFFANSGKTVVKTFTASASSSSAALLAENNFAASDDLSAIVENNLSSVSEIETQDFDTLTQENLITFAK